ncbi:MAG: hypothetical protein EA387_11095 [Nitriliruptor sp.]|nr:MAG: hypothetical protein EA387_11095 [Nitriliruptor sp.]
MSGVPAWLGVPGLPGSGSFGQESAAFPGVLCGLVAAQGTEGEVAVVVALPPLAQRSARAAM